MHNLNTILSFIFQVWFNVICSQDLSETEHTIYFPRYALQCLCIYLFLRLNRLELLTLLYAWMGDCWLPHLPSWCRCRQIKRLLKGSKKTTRLLESFDGLRLWILLRDGRAGLFFHVFMPSCKLNALPLYSESHISTREQMRETPRFCASVLRCSVRDVRRKVGGVVHCINRHTYMTACSS